MIGLYENLKLTHLYASNNILTFVHFMSFQRFLIGNMCYREIPVVQW